MFLYITFIVGILFFPLNSIAIPSLEIYPIKIQTGTAYKQKGEDVQKTLTQIPGVFIESAGSEGQIATPHVRGLQGLYTMVLVDGIPFRDAGSGIIDLSKLSSMGLDQVIRFHGPEVLLYTPYAGSILDLRTKNSSKKTIIDLKAGSFDTATASVKSTIIRDHAQHIIVGNHNQTAGLPKYGSSRIYGERNRYYQENGGVLSTITLGNQTTLKTQVRAMESLLKYDQSMPPLPLKPQGTQENKALLLGASLAHETWKGVQHEISISHTDQEATYEGSEGTSGKESRLQYHQDIPWSSRHRMRLVIEATNDSLRQKKQFQSHRTTFGGAVLHSIDLTSRWQLEGGMRQNYTKHYTQNPLGTAGLSWNNSRTKFYGSWRQGCRLPTLYDQRGESPFFQPNPTLKQEKVDFWEGGWVQKFKDKGSFQWVYFYNQINQRIVGVPLDLMRSTVRNLNGKTTTKGTEVSIHYLWFDTVFLKGAYTYTEGDRGCVTPKHQAALSIIKEESLWTIESTVSYTGNRQDWSQKHLPFYIVHDIKLAYTVKDQWRIYGMVKNLWDERYETISTYRTPRRTFYVGTSFIF